MTSCSDCSVSRTWSPGVPKASQVIEAAHGDLESILQLRACSFEAFPFRPRPSPAPA